MGVSEQKARSGCASACCGVCSFLSLALGVLLLLVGIWCAHLHQRFTPVYRDIECRSEPPEIKRVWFDHGLQGMHLQLVTTTSCDNPNPYTVVMRSTKAGAVYMGSDRTRVGAVDKIPAAELPASGSGSIVAEVVITPTADVFGSVFEFLGSGHTPIYMESNMEIQVDIDFLFGNFSTTRSISKDCGLNMKVDGLRPPAVGPMACADSWEGLEIPAVGSEATDKMTFSASAVGGQEDIEEATHLKNAVLGAGMGVGFGLGLVLVACGAFGLLRACRRAKAPAVAESHDVNSTKDIGQQQVINPGAGGRMEEV